MLILITAIKYIFLISEAIKILNGHHCQAKLVSIYQTVYKTRIILSLCVFGKAMNVSRRWKAIKIFEMCKVKSFKCKNISLQSVRYVYSCVLAYLNNIKAVLVISR